MTRQGETVQSGHLLLSLKYKLAKGLFTLIRSQC